MATQHASRVRGRVERPWQASSGADSVPAPAQRPGLSKARLSRIAKTTPRGAVTIDADGEGAPERAVDHESNDDFRERGSHRAAGGRETAAWNGRRRRADGADRAR